MNPLIDGLQIRTGIDLFAKGMSDKEMESVYYDLVSDREQELLLMESATIDEVDEAYNPGETEAILEAITVKKFAQTESKMIAMVRVLNTHSTNGISALDPIIGRPRKNGLFATVTVQVPMSDGQVVSVVFHSPSGSEKKILPDDMIVAFRWLLNKRDITHAVSPEKGRDVSLQTVAKRVMQLVARNSEKFQKSQAEIKAQKDELLAIEQGIADQGARNSEIESQIADIGVEAERIDDAIELTSKRLEKVRAENEDLEARLEGLRAAKQSQIDSSRLAELRDRARELGFDSVADQLYLAKDEAGLQVLIDSVADTSADETLEPDAEEPEPVEPEGSEESEPTESEEPEPPKVGVLPSAEQTDGMPSKRAAKILHATGNADAAMKDGFYAKIKSGAYQDLVIETHAVSEDTQRIHFIQYDGGNIDSEMIFDANIYSGILKLAEIAYMGPIGEVRRSKIGRAEKSWANTFSKNLVDQEFDKGMVDGGDEVIPVPTPGKAYLHIKKDDQGDWLITTTSGEVVFSYHNKQEAIDMARIIETSRRYIGAFMKAEQLYSDTKEQFRNITKYAGKSYRDAFLMERFGISEIVSRDITNKQTSMNIPPDTSDSVSIEEFGDTIWGKNAMAKIASSSDASGQSGPEPEPQDAEPEVEAVEPEAVSTLNRIIAGEFDDNPEQIDLLLDQSAEALDAVGLAEQYDEILNQAADHYTKVLKREAA
jgi:hypothetical protein